MITKILTQAMQSWASLEKIEDFDYGGYSDTLTFNGLVKSWEKMAKVKNPDKLIYEINKENKKREMLKLFNGFGTRKLLSILKTNRTYRYGYYGSDEFNIEIDVIKSILNLRPHIITDKKEGKKFRRKENKAKSKKRKSSGARRSYASRR